MAHTTEQLAKYLPTQIYKSIFLGEKDAVIETQRKTLTNFFSDLVGFTSKSEEMGQQKLTNWLNTYLNDMAGRLAQETPLDNGFDPHNTSIHVGVISGGTALNIVSRHCEFVWDIRNIPGDDPAKLIGEFERYCRDEILPNMRSRHAECFIKTENLSQVPALIPSESPALTLVQSLSGSNEVRQVAYGTEGGQFQEAQFPTVICGPGSIDQAHQPNEFISKAQVQEGEIFIRRLIERLSA